METWLIWLIIAFALLVIELLSGSIIFLCFSLGCLAAIIPAAFGAGLAWQILTFAVATVICFVYLRPAIQKSALQLKGKEARTNMDAIIGRTGKVTHEVTNNADDKGRVQIDGDNWLAYTSEVDVPIPRGTQVVVENYDSIVIKVRRQNQ